MWWSRLFALIGLAGCGFTPVYGPGGAAHGLYGQIAVAAPEDPTGYALVRRIEDRLGRGGAPGYALDADLRLDDEGLGITSEQEITRIQIKGELTYTLTEIATGRVVDRGLVSSFTGYSAPVVAPGRNSIAGNAVTVRAAREDALERLTTILADQLTARLLATAPDWRQ